MRAKAGGHKLSPSSHLLELLVVRAMNKKQQHDEAKSIRRHSEHGRPRPLGTAMSFGFGDRVGLATLGHIAALRESRPDGLMPVFAQQSVRELTRTHRTAHEVMDAATVAVYRAGWDEPWGADADHLKSVGDIQTAVEAGYTMFTLDPSDTINERAEGLHGKDLIRAFDALFESAADRKTYLNRYAGSDVEFATGETFHLAEEEVRRVAVTYLRAIAELVVLARYLQKAWSQEDRFDLEISIDETTVPTSPEAHWIIASELDRAGIHFTSLAPRFVGTFEKGVEYRGSHSALDEHIAIHAEIARTLGPYKLSLHSGSDKFSVYPVLARHSGELLHVKTAGTSYLEALRVVCRHDPKLFREVADLSKQVFVTSRDSYHLSTNYEEVPAADQVSDSDLEDTFLKSPESDDARQVLHVAFGEILTDAELGTKVVAVLEANAVEHAACLEAHFVRHLAGLG